MTTSEILSFTEKPIIDESIQEYEHHEYELTLVRKSDDDAIFRTAAVAAGKVVLDKISWFMTRSTS